MSIIIYVLTLNQQSVINEFIGKYFLEMKINKISNY